jgi:hypothetical protein
MTSLLTAAVVISAISASLNRLSLDPGVASALRTRSLRSAMRCDLVDWMWACRSGVMGCHSSVEAPDRTRVVAARMVWIAFMVSYISMLCVSPAERLLSLSVCGCGWISEQRCCCRRSWCQQCLSLVQAVSDPMPMEMMIDFVDERAILFLAVGTKVGVGREKANVSKTIRQPESLNETSFKGMRSKGYCSLKSYQQFFLCSKKSRSC